MADDGLLINFDLDDGPFVAKTSYRGGSWKDRLTAKKAAQYNHVKRNKDSATLNRGEDPTQFRETSVRPLKKLRVDDTVEYAARARPNRQNKPNTSERRVHANSKPGQVISSLFTFNPVSQTEQDGSTEPTENIEPSNAPLKSELDTFTSLGLSPQLAEHLYTKLDIKAPTAIQRSSITHLVRDDNDAFIQAETGSGKTLAYLLPIVQRIMSLSSHKPTSGPAIEDGAVHRDSGLFAIIIAPTRELSKQIAVVLEGLLRCAHWIVSGIVIGGEKKKSEKARLRKGLNILIATPGRLADHLDHTEALDVSNVRWVVLDEGDRLMELGFEKDIEAILSKLNTRASKSPPIKGLPIRRTTILCSATMKMDVQKLGEISLKDAVHIKSDPSDENTQQIEKPFSAPAQLQQSYAIVPAKMRLVTLVALLKRTFSRRGSVMKAIIFMSCADSVDFHFELLAHGQDGATPSSDTASKVTQLERPSPDTPTPSSTKPKLPTSNTLHVTSATAPTLSSPTNPEQVYIHRLHGSLPQPIRTSTLHTFTHTKSPSILLSTDVASRGLDLPNIDLVIEYDPPFAKEDHLHRIGRTARAGRDGRALIFLQPGAEEGYVDVLKETRAEAVRGLARHDAEELLRRGFASVGTGGVSGKDWEDKATEWQLAIERWVQDDARMLEMARRAFQSHVRSYATHVAAERHVFDMTKLHLGHLAKAFALRDKPGNMKVPGMRPEKTSGRKERRAGVKGAGADEGAGRSRGVAAGAEEGVGAAAVDVHEAMRKMRRKAREAAGGAAEFNIG